MAQAMIRFSGEYISAESGEETPFAYLRVGAVRQMVTMMKDGDTMVINATEEGDGGI